MKFKWLLMVLLANPAFNELLFAMDVEDEGWVMVAPEESTIPKPAGEKYVAPENLKAYYEKLHNDWARTAQRYRNQGVDFFDWAGYRKFEGFSDRNLETVKDLYSIILPQRRLTEEELKAAKDIKAKLAANYKIHLMPYDEDMNVILNRILREISTNPSFKKLIHAFKIKLATRDLKKGDVVLPKIVIYPISGKENAQAVLDKVYELTQDIRGMNITPRYNEKMTDLLYVAQGDGEYKGKADAGFYEPGFIYYSPTFEEGQPKNYHLKNPALEGWEIVED